MHVFFAAALSFAYALAALFSGVAFASDDAVRNSLARKDCIRGTFKDYYLQGQGGDPAADYKGKVFKLSQDYPAQLPPAEDYPWLKIPFKNAGPADPQAYLQALLDYGLRGNIESISTSRTTRPANGTGCPGWTGTPRLPRTGRAPTVANSCTA